VTRFAEGGQQEPISDKMHGAFASRMVPRETRNLLRLLRALVVAWVLMFVLILWLAVKSQTSGETRSAKPVLSTRSRVSAEFEIAQLASRIRRAGELKRQCDGDHNRA